MENTQKLGSAFYSDEHFICYYYSDSNSHFKIYALASRANMYHSRPSEHRILDGALERIPGEPGQFVTKLVAVHETFSEFLRLYR
jgi:hypothetical protein